MAGPKWFCDAFGFAELDSFDETRAAFTLEEQPSSLPPWLSEAAELVLRTDLGDARSFIVGPFETPSVEELRGRHPPQDEEVTEDLGRLVFRNGVGEARAMTLDPANAGCVFQVASQFNCLEMINPDATPEQGITVYSDDNTQGPACAMACPAAILYRNYLWQGRGQAGGAGGQLDNAKGAGEVVGNGRHGFWEMRNGYLLPARDELSEAARVGELRGERGQQQALPKEQMQNWSMAELAVVLTDDGVARRTRDAMRVGVHWDTETASTDARTARKKGRVAEERTRPHRVCQVFCSAVPVAYAQKETTVTHEEMEGISMLALEAAFEATLLAAALLSSARGERVTVYLTAVGGGMFGNPITWVGEALYRALSLCRDSPLDVVMVHFGQLPEDNTPLEYLERLFGEEQAKHAA